MSTTVVLELGIIPESLALSFTSCYFVVDMVDCILRKDFMFLFHAVISLALMLGSSLSPVHYKLHSYHKGMLTEGSTPMLNCWQKTKKKIHYIFFFALFTIFRIVWVPIFLSQTWPHVSDGSSYDRAVIYLGYVWYLLQLAWYVKMIGILINYKEEDEREKNGKTD
mmetsp:Transcript_26256/g.60375  ORF Transcript_26256/g.60375 Transcript_26256/m.60375 type:complete len:166 (+) Transcript_26256:442-939(+)